MDIPGTEIPVPSGRPLLLLLGGGAVLGLLLLARRPSPAMGQESSGQFSPEQQLEFAKIQSEAQTELETIRGSNTLQQKQIDAQYMLARLSAPSAIAGSVSSDQWSRLPVSVRRNIQSQVRNGQVLITPDGRGGFTYTSTAAGAAGHAPLVRYNQSTGPFSADSSVTGPAGSVQPLPAGQPWFASLIAAILPEILAFFSGSPAALFAGSASGTSQKPPSSGAQPPSYYWA